MKRGNKSAEYKSCVLYKHNILCLLVNHFTVEQGIDVLIELEQEGTGHGAAINVRPEEQRVVIRQQAVFDR